MRGPRALVAGAAVVGGGWLSPPRRGSSCRIPRPDLAFALASHDRWWS